MHTRPQIVVHCISTLKARFSGKRDLNAFLRKIEVFRQNEIPWCNPFWPTAVVGEADSVNSVSASACHIGGPKGVSPGQKALLHGTIVL